MEIVKEKHSGNVVLVEGFQREGPDQTLRFYYQELTDLPPDAPLPGLTPDKENFQFLVFDERQGETVTEAAYAAARVPELLTALDRGINLFPELKDPDRIPLSFDFTTDREDLQIEYQLQIPMTEARILQERLQQELTVPEEPPEEEVPTLQPQTGITGGVLRELSGRRNRPAGNSPLNAGVLTELSRRMKQE